MNSEDSYHNFMMFSNENWSAPADAGSRRYCVFEMSYKYVGKHKQGSEVDKLYVELWGFALELLMHYHCMGPFSARAAPGRPSRCFRRSG